MRSALNAPCNIDWARPASESRRRSAPRYHAPSSNGAVRVMPVPETCGPAACAKAGGAAMVIVAPPRPPLPPVVAANTAVSCFATIEGFVDAEVRPLDYDYLTQCLCGNRPPPRPPARASEA